MAFPHQSDEPPESPDRPATRSVRELCDEVSGVLRDAFAGEVWVRGAIQDLSRARSGHVYFSLVDGDEPPEGPRATLAVMLSSTDKVRVNRLLRRAGGAVRMADGTEVRIRGRVDLYGPRSQLQLRMASIDPSFTLGRLALARAELLARLGREGLLTANGERPMPLLPLRVAIVTSVGSAAEADVLHELDRWGLAFSIEVLDVRVQGPEAPASIASAIAEAGRRSPDVVLVVRGGGSATDLSAFDQEAVALAIAHCPHPVITGIGHETDRSVADEVAHTAAKTPTAAANAVVERVAQAAERAEVAHRGVIDRVHRRLARADEALRRTVDELPARVGRRLGSARTEVDRIALDHERATRRRLDAARRRLDGAAALAAAVDPAAALRRGWTITRDDRGRVVRSVDQVEEGVVLVTTFVDGSATSTVASLREADRP